MGSLELAPIMILIWRLIWKNSEFIVFNFSRFFEISFLKKSILTAKLYIMEGNDNKVSEDITNEGTEIAENTARIEKTKHKIRQKKILGELQKQVCTHKGQ